METYHKSNGQGNLFSRMGHRVSVNGSSVITRLTSRLKRAVECHQLHSLFPASTT